MAFIRVTTIPDENVTNFTQLPPIIETQTSDRSDTGRVTKSQERLGRPIRPLHLLKTVGVALALTGLFLLPQFLIHLPTGIIAPISAGITTGGMMKVRPYESLAIGLTLFAVITAPAPLAYHWFGFANHLPFIAIFVFSFVFGLYYGTLIGVFSWVGARINASKIGA